MPVDVIIATPLENDLVERIRREVPEVTVHMEPGLLPPTRFPCDHRGDPDFRRSEEDERRWWELLARGEVFFGIPGDTPEGLSAAVRACPRLQWIQATAAGAGEQVRAAGLRPDELERVRVTSSAGVHAGPLAEFALFGMLAFAKDLPRLRRDQEAGHWDHYPMHELSGGTVLVLGVGGIGLEVARLAKAFGMHVIGVKRVPDAAPYVDEMHDMSTLPELAVRADAVVSTLPATEQTIGLLSRDVLGMFRRDCVLVNVGRGAVVDEDALAEALAGGRLAGAALDVFTQEPLPADSPLWKLDNVIMAPHTAALSVAENRRIVSLFIDNLRRYRLGKPLRNLIDIQHFY